MDGRGLKILESAHWNTKQYNCSERHNKNQAIVVPWWLSVVGVDCHTTAQRAVVVQYP